MRLPLASLCRVVLVISASVLATSFSAFGAAPFSNPSPPTDAVPHLSDEGWSSEFGLPGLLGWVYCVTQFRGDLVVGGTFTAAGNPTIRNVARWDGRTWQPLGGGIPGRFPNSITVLKLAVYKGDLIAAGAIDSVENRNIRGIARWDGAQWDEMGTGVTGDVYALAVQEGKLVVGGAFSEAGGQGANNVAVWDGHEWSALGAGFNRTVNALAVFHKQIVAAGDFTTSGSTPVVRLARWNGTAWDPLSGGFESLEVGNVWALGVYQDRLIASGNFLSYWGAPADLIAAWDGEAWSGLGISFRPRPSFLGVSDIRVFRKTLVISGDFETSDRAIADLASWDGMRWSSPAPPLTGSCHEWSPNDERPWNSVEGMSEFDGDLIVAGCFRFAGNHDVNSIARWDGQDWRPFGSGQGLRYHADGVVVQDGTVLVYPVAGVFRDGSTTETFRGIAAWDGSSWRSLGAAADTAYVERAVVQDGRLVVSGYFPSIGARGIAEWNGSDWNLIYEGVPSVLAVFGGSLYAAVPEPGTPATYRVIRRDGSQWSLLGGSFDKIVYTLAGHEGELYAGGRFTSVDGHPSSPVARWDGTAWQPLAGVFSSRPPGPVTVMALLSFDGRLIVGGFFTGIGDLAAWNIAAWDGSGWHALGEGLSSGLYSSSPVRTLIAFKGTLLAGGNFQEPDGTQKGLAAWDRREWYEFGTTAGSGVSGFAVKDDDLYVSGSFNGIGGRASYGIAHWSPPTNRSARAPEGRPLSVSIPSRGAGVVLSYVLPQHSHVRVTLFNIAGQLVTSRDEGFLPPGEHTVVWNGDDKAGFPTPSGIYLARIEVNGTPAATVRLLKIR